MWSLMCIDTDKALFVKSVFEREHLTGICSMVYFHPFSFSPQDRVSLRSSMKASECWNSAEEHRDPQTIQGEVLGPYTNTSATDASR